MHGARVGRCSRSDFWLSAPSLFRHLPLQIVLLPKQGVHFVYKDMHFEPIFDLPLLEGKTKAREEGGGVQNLANLQHDGSRRARRIVYPWMVSSDLQHDGSRRARRGV